MQSLNDASPAPTAPEDLESFLDDVEAENSAEGARRGRRDLVLGLIAIPVLFAAMVAAIVWVAPVVSAGVFLAVDFVSTID